MTFVREKFPQMVHFGKRNKCGIADVSEISKVLETSTKLQHSSTNIVRTHFKVKWNRDGMIGCVHIIQTRRQAQ